MVKPCILSDWLTGSAGAMLESNWVRVCELEERSLNVSHCCRRQTDSEKKNVSQPVQWHHTFTSSAWASTVMRHHQSSADDAVMRHQQRALKQNRRRWLSYRTAGYHHSPRSERRGAELSVIMFDNERGWRGNQIMMDGWIKKKQLHLINPEQLIMMKQMQTQQKQTNVELTGCVKIQQLIVCVVCMLEPHCSGSSLARPGWVKA